MSYTAIEAQLLALIKTVARFADTVDVTSPVRATRGDYSLLDRGIDDLVILEPGALTGPSPEWELSRPSPLQETQWIVVINLFRRIKPDEVTSVQFATARDELLNLVRQYPSLNGACGMTYFVALEAMGDPEDVYDRAGGGPFYRMQSLRVTYSETVQVTGGEY